MYFFYTALFFSIFFSNSVFSMDQKNNNDGSSWYDYLAPYVTPMTSKVAPLLDYASKKVDAAARKANPELYVTDASNQQLYADTLARLKNAEQLTYDDGLHQLDKCLNRQWYGSQALAKSLVELNSAASENNFNLNQPVLGTDLNNEIIQLIRRAKDQTLPPDVRRVMPSTSMLSSIKGVDVFDVVEQENFSTVIDTLSGTQSSQWAGFIQSPDSMGKLQQALNFQNALAKAIVQEAKRPENAHYYKQKPFQSEATQIVKTFMSKQERPLAPVFAQAAERRVIKDKEILKTLVQEADEAYNLLDY